jgi:signal peptidase I
VREHTGVRRTLALVAGIAAAVWLLRRRAFPVRVTGRSMSPTLEPGDLVAVTPLRRRPGRGEIVVLRRSEGPEMIKRVAALGGETFGGRPVPRRSLALSGDNRSESTDSREFGPVSEAEVAGRALVVYWPPRRWRIL